MVACSRTGSVACFCLSAYFSFQSTQSGTHDISPGQLVTTSRNNLTYVFNAHEIKEQMLIASFPVCSWYVTAGKRDVLCVYRYGEA